MGKEKGSALITVILVVLVLTMVGVASLFFMSTEERTANISRLEKAAFYAAEVGLRRAESSIQTQYDANPYSFLTSALSYNPAPQTEWNVLQVPNGGTVHPTAVVLTDTLDATLSQPRVDPAVSIIDPANATIAPFELRGIVVDDQSSYITTYNIYIRNDDDDLSNTVDSNDKVSIVSVGLLVTPSGQVIRKVIEEGVAPLGAGTAGWSVQIGVNTGGTGSV